MADRLRFDTRYGATNQGSHADCVPYLHEVPHPPVRIFPVGYIGKVGTNRARGSVIGCGVAASGAVVVVGRCAARCSGVFYFSVCGVEDHSACHCGIGCLLNDGLFEC